MGSQPPEYEQAHRVIAREQRAADPFVDAVMRSIAREDGDSFSERPLTALSHALTRPRLASRPIVDAREIIPLFFARFHPVLLFGVDQRDATVSSLMDRRRRGSLLAGVLLTAGIGLGLVTAILLIVFVFRDLLKTTLGIDIFPDSHLWDLLSG